MDKDKIDVSIIIPVYNVERYIAECLDSVMAQQTACHIECFVVDDCGTDNSMSIARELIGNYRGQIDFNIITREKNGGLSAARNSGISAARGKYIYFLDSDDVITPDCIDSLMDRAKRHPSAQIIVGNFQTFPQRDVYRHLSLEGKKFPDYSDDVRWIRSIFLSKFPVTSWNKLIKRNFILQNNLYFKEGILHEDNHWQAQAYHMIESIAVVNRVTYLYRMREGSITAGPDSNRKRLNNMRIILDEMFSKKVAWDKGWAEWVYYSLSDLKFSPIYRNDRVAALDLFKSMARRIQHNNGVPTVMRLLFGYWGAVSHRGQERLVNFIFRMYWNRI